MIQLTSQVIAWTSMSEKHSCWPKNGGGALVCFFLYPSLSPSGGIIPHVLGRIQTERKIHGTFSLCAGNRTQGPVSACVLFLSYSPSCCVFVSFSTLTLCFLLLVSPLLCTQSGFTGYHLLCLFYGGRKGCGQKKSK